MYGNHAVGSGSPLAVELRVDDLPTAHALAPLNDPATQFAVAAERGVMKAVEGNCQVPVAALAVQQAGQLWLRGLLATPDGSRCKRAEASHPWPSSAPEAERWGLELGNQLRQAL